MTPGKLDIEVPRNGSDYREYQMVDDDGEPIDLTGWGVSAWARNVAGGTVIATGETALVEPSAGTISVKWLGSQFDGYGHPQAAAMAVQDIKLVDPTGLPIVPVRGRLLITGEATA